MIAMRRPEDDEDPELDVISFVEHISNFTGAVQTVDKNLDRIATALERLAEKGEGDKAVPSARVPLPSGLQATGG